MLGIHVSVENPEAKDSLLDHPLKEER